MNKSDTELDQMLKQIFQGAESLPIDEALERACELEEEDNQDFDPLSVLVTTIARIIVRLDRIESALNKLAPQNATYTCPWCGKVSHNPNDLANRYCGACHRWGK